VGSCFVAGFQHQPGDAFGDFGCHLRVPERSPSQLRTPFLVIGAGCHIHGVMKPDRCFDLVDVSSQGSAGVEES
jgi:hypothetical protein